MTTFCGTGGWSGPVPGDPDNNVTLSAVPAFGGIDVSWTYPGLNPHAVIHTKLYRGTSSNFNSSILRHIVAGNFFYDKLDTGVTYYYWIELVSVNGTIGSPIGPASATAKPLIDDLIEQITGHIDAGVLATSLKGTLDNISLINSNLLAEITDREGGETTLAAAIADVADGVAEAHTFIATESNSRVTGNTALAEQISLVASTSASDIASVVTTVNTWTGTVSTLSDKATALGALYTTKLTVNGLVGGFGVYNDGTTVEAGFDVNTFWVGTTGANKRKPFIVTGGVTYIDSAVISMLNANQIDTRGLTIKDDSGTIIFGAGTSLDWNRIGGSNKAADGATRNVFIGNWATGVSYLAGDIVMEAGYGWSAITNHTSSSVIRPPTYPTSSNAYWSLYTVKGDAGIAGANGTRTAILDMYRNSAGAPTTFPSGTSTYTWATGLFTAPATPNSWTLTPPAPVGGQDMYVVRQLFSDNNTSATSEVGWAATTSRISAAAGEPGTPGANGARTAFLEVYIWSTSTPTLFPSGTSTYTWATGAFTAPTTANGWALLPGAQSPGQTLWACSVRLTNTTTVTTDSVTWSTSTAYPVGAAGSNGATGDPGVNGTRTAVLDVYQWSLNAPTLFPSGSSTYTWSTGQFTAPGTLNGWSLTPPNPVFGQTLWIARQLFADTTVTTTSTVSWATSTARPTTYAGNNGSRTAYLEVYKWSATTPVTFPSGTSTYTWATGAFTAPTTAAGWSLTPGAAVAGQTLWACAATLANTTLTTTDSVTWSTSTAFAVGAAGTNGSAGLNAVVAILSNEAHSFPAANDGTVSSYVGSGTQVRVYEGAAELTYDGVGTSAGTWAVTSAVTNITRGTLSGSTYLTVGDHSAVAAGTDTASIVYTITGKTAAGTSFTTAKTQTFSKSKVGAVGAVGAAGPSVVVTTDRPATFTATDGSLDVSQFDLILTAATSGIASPTYAWTFSGLQTNPTASTTSVQTITSAQFGNAKSAIAACTVNGTYVDKVTIVRLEKSTAVAGATVGAPAGTLVNGIPVADVTAAVSNFNASNDRLSTAVTAPTIPTTLAVEHTLQTDGSADISFDWLWSGNEGDIDGFIVYVRNSATATAYTFGTTVTEETAYNVPANKRAFIVYGTAVNKYYTFGIQAYRTVDKDINSSGVIKSSLVKVTTAGMDPYLPSASVVYTGDVTGTIGGTAASTVRDNAANALTNASTAQTAANNAQTSANTANTAIANIGSDSILSPGEKPGVKLDYDIIIAEQTGIDAQATSYSITTEKTTYDTAVTALTSYLGTLTGWNTIPGSDVTIVPATFRTKFQDVYTSRQALLNAIAAKAKVLADAAQTQANTATTNAATAQTQANTATTNAATAQTQANTATTNAATAQAAADAANSALANIASDSILSPSEKPSVKLDYDTIVAEQTGIDSQATAYAITTEKTTYDTAVTALTTYLGTLTGWNSIPGSDVSIVGTTFRTKFQDVYTARQALLNAIAAKAKVLADTAQTQANTATTNAATAQSQANTATTNAATAQTAANTANSLLADIASDNKFTPVEKQSSKLEWAALYAEKAGINSSAAAQGVTTENVTYNNAFQALGDYLNNGTAYTIGATHPAWINGTELGNTTDITGSVFRTTWSAVYSARQALLNKIAEVAATKATWSSVSGTGRPADNATVGATFGTDISGQITSANASTYIAAAAIGNAQIGGTIQSDTYSAGTAGWAISKSGSAEFNTGTFRGALSAATGTFAGTLTAAAVNAVNTINIANNSVSVSNSATGTSTASTTISVPAGQTMQICAIAYYASGSALYSQTATLTIDGNSTTGGMPSVTAYGPPDGSPYTVVLPAVLVHIVSCAGGAGRSVTISSSCLAAGVTRLVALGFLR